VIAAIIESTSLEGRSVSRSAITIRRRFVIIATTSASRLVSFVGDRDVRTGAGIGDRNRAPNSVTTTHDQNKFSVEVLGDYSPPPRIHFQSYPRCDSVNESRDKLPSIRSSACCAKETQGGNAMKILKRKDILSKTITVRVSPQVKAEFDQLRERADAAGFDLGATLRETISNTARQIRTELDAIDRKIGSPSVEKIVNGFDHANGGSFKAKL
jgi:hypothetical protein